MALTFDPTTAAMVKDEPHWRPTNLWRPRSLTPAAAARTRYVQAARMEPHPQAPGRQATATFMDASFVATQLTQSAARDPDRARSVPHPRQGTQTAAGASRGHHHYHHHHAGHRPTQLRTSDGDPRGHGAEGTGLQGCRGGQEKGGSCNAGHDSTERNKVVSQRTGHHAAEQDQAGRDKTRHDKTGYDKTGYRTEIGHKTGHDQTGRDNTRQDKTGQDKTEHDKTWRVMERSRNRVSQTRTAKPVQKEALRPSVLTLGHSDTADSLRVTPSRCHSADRPSSSPSSSSKPPITTSGRSTGSPYLQDQQVNSSSSHHQKHQHHHDHHHQQQHHQQQRYHPSPRHRPPQHYHHQAGRERSKSTEDGTSRAVVKVVSAAAPHRRHVGEDLATPASPGRRQASGDDRVGRCEASNTPFYKAALALMQTQRLWASGFRGSPSPSASTASSSSSHTSPRGSVFYLPPPPPPPPQFVWEILHSPRDATFLSQQHRSPHDDLRHHHPGHGQPKSILRPPPSPVSARSSKVGWNSGPVHSRAVHHHASRSSAQSPFTPRRSDGVRVTPRKKVTFGSNVIVRLQPHVELSGRAMSSSV